MHMIFGLTKKSTFELLWIYPGEPNITQSLRVHKGLLLGGLYKIKIIGRVYDYYFN